MTRAEQSVDTRNRVFQAALDEFVRVGVAAAQVDAIVRKAKVSVGTYYRYFPSKDAVLIELLQRYLAELAPRLQEQFQQPGQDLRAALLAIVELVFCFYKAHDQTLIREIFAVLVKQTPHDIDWLALPLVQPIVEQLAEEHRQGRSGYADPAIPARIFFTALMGFLAAMSPVRHHESARMFVDLFLRGIRPETKP